MTFVIELTIDSSQYMSGSKRIPLEIRDEILSKVKEGRPATELAEQYGISTKTIYNWISYTTVSSSHQISPLEYHRLKRENDELKKIIGLLTLQIERGKKD